jgi:hypothetical protein
VQQMSVGAVVAMPVTAEAAGGLLVRLPLRMPLLHMLLPGNLTTSFAK